MKKDNSPSSLFGKVGQKVKVVSNKNKHGFNIGSTVVIVELCPDANDQRYGCFGRDLFGDKDKYYLSESEVELPKENLELIESGGKPRPKKMNGLRIIQDSEGIKIQFKNWLGRWINEGVNSSFGKNETTYSSVEEAEVELTSRGLPTFKVLKEY